MTDNTLHINVTKTAEIEFDVHIQGIKADDETVVRFVIKDADHGGSLLFDCDHLDESKWCVKFPILKRLLKHPTYTFILEVIIDGYYFSPVEGTIALISDPTVEITKKKLKPSVKASFVVKQDGEKAPIIKEYASQSAGDMADRTAPTNALLTPEFPVEDTHGSEDEDEDDDPAGIFDAGDIANEIIRGKMGRPQLPATKGFLFKRTPEGRTHIKGLEDKATKQQVEDRSNRVKQILADH